MPVAMSWKNRRQIYTDTSGQRGTITDADKFVSDRKCTGR